MKQLALFWLVFLFVVFVLVTGCTEEKQTSKVATVEQEFEACIIKARTLDVDYEIRKKCKEKKREGACDLNEAELDEMLREYFGDKCWDSL
jgi:hypothetical protein